MDFPEINVTENHHLSIDRFREMDELAINRYKIPIELMMENAGLQLARLVSFLNPGKEKVLLGIGTGNNGGGGLVAARRMAGWGYPVFLDLPDENLRELPGLQLERALACGAMIQTTEDPGVFIDAFLGFSQRPPLTNNLLKAVEKANKLKCTKLSLDLPTGFGQDDGFHPDGILTLAALKTELISLMDHAVIYLADLGLPSKVYQDFGIVQPEKFKTSGIIHFVQSNS